VYFISETSQQLSMKLVIGNLNKKKLLHGIFILEYIYLIAYPGIFFGGWVQQIQLKTEGRENGDLGAVAP
jgi:hypothetical protein